MSNLRSFLNWDGGYHLINREERNLAAIFYHVLLLGENLQRFLDFISYEPPVIPGEFGIYFEYSLLRDLWFNISSGNDLKRELIYNFLKPANKEELINMSTFEFNTFFGVPNPSRSHIQSPGNWSIKKYRSNIPKDNEFLNTCRFKWAFNAKPDIVIHTSNDAAICIECKFESGEGSYPTNKTEIEEFHRRKLPQVGQTELQKYIMEDLLGIDTTFIFLVQKANAHSDSHSSILWKDAFSNLNLDTCPSFIKEWIERL